MASAKSKDDIKVLNVESRLSKLALGPGGVARDAAIEKATVAVDGLRTDYPEWLEKDITTLQQAVFAAHENGGGDREALEAIYRKSAQIRDLGTSFDFPLVTAAADSLCELVYRLMESDAYDKKSIDCHVKALNYLKHPKTPGSDNDQSLPLVRGLKALVDRYERPKMPKPANGETGPDASTNEEE